MMELASASAMEVASASAMEVGEETSAVLKILSTGTATSSSSLVLV